MEAQALLDNGLRVYGIAAYAYFAAFLVYCYHLFFRKAAAGPLATGVLIGSWLLHTAFLVLRTMFYYEQHGGFLLPATNMFEAISYMAWMIVLAYIILEYTLLKTRKFGAFAMAIPLFLMSYNVAQLGDPGAGDPRQLFPSLKSNILWIHVSCMIISYAVFTLAATFALLYIMRAWRPALFSRLDERFSLRWLDDMSYRLTLLSFPVLSLGVFLGALWADKAWGRYWAWDPKEVWALIIWLVYLAYIHMRVQRGWVGYRPALLNILGFMMVMITFKGVNLLNDIFGLDSIHAYTSGELGLKDWLLMGAFTAITIGLIVAMFLPGPDESELDNEDDVAFMPLPPQQQPLESARAPLASNRLPDPVKGAALSEPLQGEAK